MSERVCSDCGGFARVYTSSGLVSCSACQGRGTVPNS